MRDRNLYQMLGLDNSATHEEIKKAFRFYASKFHPDKHNGDKFFEEQFREIKDAYEILADPVKKKDYDSQFIKEIKIESGELFATKTTRHNPRTQEYPSSQTRPDIKVSPEAKRFGKFLMILAGIIFSVLMFMGHDIGPVPGTSLWILFFIGLYIFKKNSTK